MKQCPICKGDQTCRVCYGNGEISTRRLKWFKIGQNIKALREKHGVTANEAARLLMVPSTWYKEIEIGKTDPRGCFAVLEKRIKDGV